MSIIHILDRGTDRILDDITEKDILDNTHEQSLKDSLESFEFTTIGDASFSEHLDNRNKIIIPNEDKGYQEFVISESEIVHDEDYIEMQVFADASYLELKKANLIEPQTFTEYTASMGLGRALRDTSWQVGVIESNQYRTFIFDKHTNPYNFIKLIAREFEMELNFRVEIVGNRIIGRYVDLLERIGKWHGVEVEFGVNLKRITRIENTDNVVTALRGISPEDEDGNRLEVLVTDNDALNRWGVKDRNGIVRHLIEVYEVESNNKNMTMDELTRYTRTELEKRIKETVEYEGSIHDLEHVPGLESYRIRYGDTIRIKDTKFNPPLYLEARIHTQRRNIVDKSKKDVVLGDYIEYTEEEITSSWREMQEEIQRKIDLKDLLDRTYDKETIDRKDEIVLGDGKEYSRNTSEEAEKRSNEYSDDVGSEVERVSKEYAEEQADRAERRALEKAVANAVFEEAIDDILGDLAGKASNSIVEELEDKIADKVDADWVDGQLVDKANVDDVYVIKDIDDMFKNVVSITEYETDIDGIVKDLSSHETRIEQTEKDISSKVERTEFEAVESDIGELGNNIDNAFTAIDQNADEISQKASQSSVNNLTGEVEEIESLQIQQAGLIASKVEQDLFDSTTNTLGNDISSVEQTVEGFTQEVASVRADLGDLDDDFAGMGEELSSHKTLIDQNADDILLRATKSEVDTVRGTVEDAQADIKVNADEIGLRAKQTDVDSLTGRVSTAESELTTHANEINARVTKDGLYAEINLNSTNAKIQAENIELVGAVSVLSDITGNLGSITAGKITGTDIEGSTISQIGESGKIVLDNSGFKVFDGDDLPRIGMYLDTDSGDTHGSNIALSFLDDNQNNAMTMGAYYTSGYIRSDESLELSAEYAITLTAFNSIGDNAVSVQGGKLSSQEGIQVSGTGVSRGVHIGSGNTAHVLAKNSSGHLLLYPQRFTGKNIFRIRSHHQRGSYRNEFTININGNALFRETVKARAYSISNNSPLEGEGNDRYQIKYNTNGDLEFISKNSSGNWFTRLSLVGRGRGNGITLWNRMRSEATRDATTTNSANFHIFTSTGRMSRTTSSRRYKLNERAVTVNPYNLLEVVPKDWHDKNEIEEYANALTLDFNGEKCDIDDIDLSKISRVPGIVAEDVEDVGLDLYVDYGRNGEVQGLKYDRLWTLLIPITKDHEIKIGELQTNYEYLKEEYEDVKTELKLMTRRVEYLEQKGA